MSTKLYLIGWKGDALEKVKMTGTLYAVRLTRLVATQGSEAHPFHLFNP